MRATVLTGLSTATNAVIAATDSFLVALGKLQAQVTARVLKAGDTMTGNLTISKANAELVLQKAASGEYSRISSFTGSSPRWVLDLGDNAPESTPASGSHLRIFRYNNSGVVQDGANGAFTIGRDDGGVYIAGRLNATTMRLGPAYTGGTGSANIQMSSDLSTGNNAIIGEYSGSRRWMLELGNTPNANFVLSRWNGGSLIGLPLTLSWSDQTWTTGGTWNHNGVHSADSFYWQGGQNALVPQSGSYATDGTSRWNIIWNTTPGQGDTGYAGHWHQPGVISFFQVQQAGVYMRYNNSGRLSVATAYDVYSDRRLKHDINDLTDIRERVESMPVKTFRKNAEAVGMAGPQIAPLNIGVIAQDAEVRNPEIVRRQLDLDNPDDPDPMRTVDAAGAGFIALAGVQDLYRRIDELTARLEACQCTAASATE